jgi:multidrug efflux pump subunit AcrA (membrane-fusion protein)
MNLLLKILRKSLPFLILGGGTLVYYVLVATKPVAERRTPPEPVIKVETQELQLRPFTVVLDSQGAVSARTESTLIPQVSGEVMRVADNFREGGFFDEGDILLEIDPSDYKTALTIAQANLAEAQVRLAEEEAQTSQAQRDWDRLGEGDIPTDLVLRVPQLALARASVAAAEARVEEARRNLERTRITAPYDGRVLS